MLQKANLKVSNKSVRQRTKVLEYKLQKQVSTFVNINMSLYKNLLKAQKQVKIPKTD